MHTVEGEQSLHKSVSVGFGGCRGLGGAMRGPEGLAPVDGVTGSVVGRVGFGGCRGLGGAMRGPEGLAPDNLGGFDHKSKRVIRSGTGRATGECARRYWANISASDVPSRRSVDRKSTRLNSSHVRISYAVFCLKKKTDLCNSARGMMMALGCIQALECNPNTCPTCVSTQHPNLAL